MGDVRAPRHREEEAMAEVRVGHRPAVLAGTAAAPGLAAAAEPTARSAEEASLREEARQRLREPCGERFIDDQVLPRLDLERGPAELPGMTHR